MFGCKFINSRGYAKVIIRGNGAACSGNSSPNVPEFSEKCSKITWSGNINEIEDIFDRQLSNPVPHNYDLDLHNPEKVVESYIEEFKSVINSNY